MHEIFISYSSRDRKVADAVCSGLEQGGIRCWMAPRDIRPGADWGASIVAAIRSSRTMVLIFSGRSNRSEHVPREVEQAVKSGVRVIPFRIEDVVPEGSLEYHLSSVHWLDAMTPPLEAHVSELKRTVSAFMDDREEDLQGKEDGQRKEGEEDPHLEGPRVAVGPGARRYGRLAVLVSLLAAVSVLGVETYRLHQGETIAATAAAAGITPVMEAPLEPPAEDAPPPPPETERPAEALPNPATPDPSRASGPEPRAGAVEPVDAEPDESGTGAGVEEITDAGGDEVRTTELPGAGNAASTSDESDPAEGERQQLREQLVLLEARSAGVLESLGQFEEQQRALGLGLRSDMVEARATLRFQLGRIGAAIDSGDVESARLPMTLARRSLEKLEGFLGR